MPEYIEMIEVAHKDEGCNVPEYIEMIEVAHKDEGCNIDGR